MAPEEVSGSGFNRSSDVGTSDFERVLDFAPSGHDSGFTKPSKQLACTRCHSQKLRCVRSRQDGRVCDRCLTVNAECIDRQPQRMGRPADHNMSRPQLRQWASRRTASHLHGPTDGATTDLNMTRPSQNRQRRKSGRFAATSTNASLTDRPTEDIPAQITPRPPSELDASTGTRHTGSSGWSWPNSSRDTSSSSLEAANANLPTASDASNPSHFLTGTGLTPYADSIAADLGDSNLMLAGIDDLATSFFVRDSDESAFALSQNYNVNDAVDLNPTPDDPVEQLSKLHLGLYQCLNTVKSVEQAKRRRITNTSPLPTEPVDTSWSERVFEITERFISALKSYVSTGTPPTISTNESSESISEPQISTGAQAVQIDTATGLMIVSCYTRLLQIFDVVVFVVETYKELDCPSNYIQISFGAFFPATNKSLHARLLGQYVLHLLDGISEAVDAAVALRQPYTRAIAEIRGAEVKLKERIAMTAY